MADFYNADPATTRPDSDTIRPPDYSLYTPGHVALATFFGSALAGGLLLASNHRKLGNSSAAWGWAVFGGVLTGLLFLIQYLVDYLPSPTWSWVSRSRSAAAISITPAARPSRRRELFSGCSEGPWG